VSFFLRWFNDSREFSWKNRTRNEVTKGTDPWDQKVQQGKQDRESRDKMHRATGPESAAGKARQGIK
jgi:hypothetical protein